MEDDLIELDEASDKATGAVPLELYLRLFLKADEQLYVNYFAGMKALRWWLGPVVSRPHNYPSFSRFFVNYTIQELAVILNVTQAEIFWTLLKVQGITSAPTNQH